LTANNETQYWCSHAKTIEEDRVLCDNFTPPQWVSNSRTCKNCSVGMIRRERDDWYEDYSEDEEINPEDFEEI